MVKAILKTKRGKWAAALCLVSVFGVIGGIADGAADSILVAVVLFAVAAALVLPEVKAIKDPPAPPQENEDQDEDDFADNRYNDQPYLPKVGNRHRIVGLNYRKENVLKLASENPLYKLDKAALVRQGITDAYVHKYTFTGSPAELVQEPDNPHDPNAIKVVVAGQHIGYIKAGSCAHLNKILNEGRVESILCRIYGGPYKGVFEVIEAEKPEYTMKTGTAEIRAEIRVIETKAE